MKKLLAIAISLSLVCSFSTVVLAENTTVLTTTVPDATYTLNIPADQEIPFGSTSANIGTITVTDSAGFAEGKDLQVTLTYDPFKADGISTTIPYTVYKVATIQEQMGNTTVKRDSETAVNSGGFLTFRGQSGGAVDEEFDYFDTSTVLDRNRLRIKASSEDWGKALAGEYSSTITFTAEVVVSEP